MDLYSGLINQAMKFSMEMFPVLSITRIGVQPNTAVVGAKAFAHEAGIHQHGVLQKPPTYEIMTPESVGVSRSQMVLGKHSGPHAFRKRPLELGGVAGRGRPEQGLHPV